MKWNWTHKPPTVVTHLVVWLLIFILPYGTFLADDEIPNFLLARLGVFNILLIIVFYANTLWLVPNTLFMNRIGLFFLGSLGLIVGFMLVALILRYLLHDFPVFSEAEALNTIPLFPEDDVRRVAFTVFPPILVIAVGTSIKLTARWKNNQDAQERQQKEQLRTELALLKSQINPHFFFNTLNNIYSLIELDVAKAQLGVLKLSKLMRYHLYKTNKDYVEIGSELEFVTDYLDLMKLRLQDFVEVELEKEVGVKHDLVPPLLLEPFVENAFKHGVSYSNPSRVHISLKSDWEFLYFKIENTMHETSLKPDEEGGLGIKNVERRLKLLFKADEYSLKHGIEKGLFTVQLKIPLKHD